MLKLIAVESLIARYKVNLNIGSLRNLSFISVGTAADSRYCRD
jgi:hypothetical protein